MSLKVIELNDVRLRIADGEGLAAETPGFALLRDGELSLGAEAEQQLRMHPTQSYFRFWHELNMTPLPGKSRIRHHADIAWSQLNQLAREASCEGEALLAVPGHYQPPQLGILLGIANQCAFGASGIVDAALAAAIDQTGTEPVVHAGLFLNQTLLTRLVHKDGVLRVDKRVQVPQLGRQQILDTLMRAANDAFILQCRFDPRHDARTEQDLYSRLADWLDDEGKREANLSLQLKAGGNSYRAELTSEQILTALRPRYRELRASLRPLLAGGGEVLLDHRLARLPQAGELFGQDVNTRRIEAETLILNCLRHADQIRQRDGNGALRLVDALPARQASAAPSRRRTPAPTHVLWGHQAVPVASLAQNGNAVNGDAAALAAADIDGLPRHIERLSLRQSQVVLDCGALEFDLNGNPARGAQTLKTGDRIRFPDTSGEVIMIEVRDGR